MNVRPTTSRDVHGTTVYGVDVGPETRCAHYHSDTDIIAIRFACCDRFYPCHACHEAAADHPAEVWPVSAFETPAVLCGACGHVLTVREYLNSESTCTCCHAAFNPGCSRHRHLYFATENDGEESPSEG
jgi:uncharacterized CHY-type Zn-finger protein